MVDMSVCFGVSGPYGQSLSAAVKCAALFATRPHPDCLPTGPRRLPWAFVLVSAVATVSRRARMPRAQPCLQRGHVSPEIPRGPHG
eukprot:1818159-Pyramimonas_sp.AAC.1